MYSVKAVDTHFWIATIGIVLYIASMWIAGVMQGLMWRAFNDDGTLTYTFIETIAATKPYYAIRLLGGTLFLSGMFIMAWNTFKTLAASEGTEFKAAEPAIGESTHEQGTQKTRKNIILMSVFIVIAVSLGGLVEILPLIFQDQVRRRPKASSPIRRCNWPAVISMSGKAVTTATRR